MFIDEFGAVPWEDQTPYILAAADRRRGIDNDLRPTKPTWEQEDDDDDFRPRGKDHPLHVLEWPEEEDGDDEASMKQNRPEDYERPRGRRARHGREAAHIGSPDDAPVEALEEPSRPAITLQAGLNQAPLYGKIIINNDRRSFRYHRTTRFNAWLESAADTRTPPDDYFHEWLRAKEAQDVVSKRLPIKMPNFDSSKPMNTVPAQPIGDSANTSSIAHKEEVKGGKRGAVSSLSSSDRDNDSWSDIIAG
jgi:hypothetical protein